MAAAGRNLWAGPAEPEPGAVWPPSVGRRGRPAPGEQCLQRWSTVFVSIAAVCVALSALMVATATAVVSLPGFVGWAAIDPEFLLLLAPLMLVAVAGSVVVSVAAFVVGLVARRQCGRGRHSTLVWSAWSAWSATSAVSTCLGATALLVPGADAGLSAVAALATLGTFVLATVATVRVAQIRPDRHGGAPNGRNGPPMGGFHPGGAGTARDA